MRAGIAATAVLLATLAGGCFTSAGDEDCRTDRDCGDLVCTRVGLCASAGGVYSLRVQWTIHGVTADQAGACDDIGELELSISDPTTGDQYAVRPVPCGAGSFFYDKLPAGFTEVTMSAYAPGGGFLDVARASAVGSSGLIQLSLLP